MTFAEKQYLDDAQHRANSTRHRHWVVRDSSVTLRVRSEPLVVAIAKPYEGGSRIP